MLKRAKSLPCDPVAPDCTTRDASIAAAMGISCAGRNLRRCDVRRERAIARAQLLPCVERPENCVPRHVQVSLLTQQLHTCLDGCKAVLKSGRDRCRRIRHRIRRMKRMPCDPVDPDCTARDQAAAAASAIQCGHLDEGRDKCKQDRVLAQQRARLVQCIARPKRCVNRDARVALLRERLARCKMNPEEYGGGRRRRRRRRRRTSRSVTTERSWVSPVSSTFRLSHMEYHPLPGHNDDHHGSATAASPSSPAAQYHPAESHAAEHHAQGETEHHAQGVAEHHEAAASSDDHSDISFTGHAEEDAPAMPPPPRRRRHRVHVTVPKLEDVSNDVPPLSDVEVAAHDLLRRARRVVRVSAPTQTPRPVTDVEMAANLLLSRASRYHARVRHMVPMKAHGNAHLSSSYHRRMRRRERHHRRVRHCQRLRRSPLAYRRCMRWKMGVLRRRVEVVRRRARHSLRRRIRQCRRAVPTYESCAAKARRRFLARSLEADHYDVVYRKMKGEYHCAQHKSSETTCVARLRDWIVPYVMRLRVAAAAHVDAYIVRRRPTTVY